MQTNEEYRHLNNQTNAQRERLEEERVAMQEDMEMLRIQLEVMIIFLRSPSLGSPHTIHWIWRRKNNTKQTLPDMEYFTMYIPCFSLEIWS